ncbi:unnamed protein product [Scytosiphon promiscuus]
MLPPTVCADNTPATVSWAANILSGGFGSVTAVLASLTVEEWTRASPEAYNVGAAAAASLMFSLSPLAWEYNTGSEVFSLNNVLVAASAYLTVRIVMKPNMNLARIGAVVCGLALSNQHSACLVLGPLAMCVLRALAEESLLSYRTLAELGGLWFPVGLSPYATLLLSARRPQQGSWGDVSSVQGFLRHVLRAEYGTLKLGIPDSNSEGALERILEYLVDSSRQTMHLGLPMAVLGIGWAMTSRHKVVTSTKQRQEIRRVRAFSVGMTAAWAFYVAIWHSVFSNISLHHPMSRAVHGRFWIQPNLLLCLAAGGGLGLVANTIASFLWRGLRRCRLSKDAVTAGVSLLLPSMLTAAILWLRWDMLDSGAWGGRSHGWTVHLYGQALLSALPEGALLLSHTDLDLNPARYLRVCENLRTDVTHISIQMMPYPWWDSVQAELHAGVIFPPILRGVNTRRNSEGNAVLITRFLAANLQRGRPIFLDMQAVDESEIGSAGLYRGFSLVPHGLTYLVLPKLTLQESERWHEEIVKQLRSLDECMELVSANRYRPGTWEFAAASVYWDAHYQAGLFFLSYGIGVWESAPRAEQRPHLLPALRDASALLLRTLEAVDAHGTFSSSRPDLLKNTILAEIRYLQALQAEAVGMPHLRSKSEPSSVEMASRMEGLFAEMVKAKERCVRLIPRFMKGAINDKDAEAFGKVYVKLRGESYQWG